MAVTAVWRHQTNVEERMLAVGTEIDSQIIMNTVDTTTILQLADFTTNSYTIFVYSMN